MGKKQPKTVGSRIADVIVWLISLAILASGFLAFRVYQAGPARNAYEVSAGIFEETNKDLVKVRGEAEKYVDNCVERSGNEEACLALIEAYNSSDFPPVTRLSRLASQDEYKKQAKIIDAQTERAVEAVSVMKVNEEIVRDAIYAKLDPVRAPMFDVVKNAKSEIDASQHIISERQGAVNQSIIDSTQAAIDNLQALVDEAYDMESENPDDYIAMTSRLKESLETLTNWNIKLRLA